jgi:hypothetical protein
MAVTRAFLRRSIGVLTRQMFVATATATGTTTTLVDSVGLTDPTNALQGRIGWVSAGTAANLYKTLRVTANSSSSTSITFTPALPSATAEDDEIELWNDLDQGVVPREIHELINLAIESVANNNPTPAVSATQTFARDSRVLTIPEGWRWFEGVDWEDAQDRWSPIPQQYLRVHAGDRTVTVLDPIAVPANTLSVRMRGATRPVALTKDFSITNVDADYIVNFCCYYVMSSVSNTSMEGQAFERKASDFKTNMQALKPQAFTRPQGLGIVL